MRTFALAALAAIAIPGYCIAQAVSPETPSADPVITVEYSNPSVSPSNWTLSMHPDGRGHFRSRMASTPSDPAGEMHTPDVNRDVQLSSRFAESAFHEAQSHAWFTKPCESHMKVAFQGWKTLSYSGPEGKGSCTYNYSKDKNIQALGDSFVAVSQTILEGVRLEMLLQHDPLGLEKEMESLSAAAQDGRAQQICAIKEILQRLAEDDNVMEMVRKRAKLLLARAQAT